MLKACLKNVMKIKSHRLQRPDDAHGGKRGCSCKGASPCKGTCSNSCSAPRPPEPAGARHCAGAPARAPPAPEAQVNFRKRGPGSRDPSGERTLGTLHPRLTGSLSRAPLRPHSTLREQLTWGGTAAAEAAWAEPAPLRLCAALPRTAITAWPGRTRARIFSPFRVQPGPSTISGAGAAALVSGLGED